MNVFSLLPDFLQGALVRLNIIDPTPVQQAALPPALNGQDVLGTAQTGTGKTFAFLLPMTVRLVNHPAENALILSPTRELAQQTYQEFLKLADPEHPLPAALVIGGDNIHKQYADLRRKPRVIIATPGRLIDHIGRKSVELKNIRFWVLDETDRMLDMGFIDDMRKIAAALPSPRQTLLFSATLPKEIVGLAGEFLHSPARVKIGSTVSPADLVVQEIIRVNVREKLPQLLHELNTRLGAILVFTRTKHGAERLAKQLKMYGQKANALHGDLRQNRRRQVLEFFKSGAVRVLVATDVAARGIDVPNLSCVINYDLPQCPEDYIHRIGRTGRAGSVGTAVSLISDDMDKWSDICKVTKFSLPVRTVEKTIEPLPAPKFVAQEEGAAHSKNRKREKRTQEKRVQVPSKATQLAKKLLAEGEVYLPQPERRTDAPQAEKIPAAKAAPAPTVRPAKKPKTFHKASVAAHILEEEKPHNPFAVKVGASKKTLKELAQKKQENPRKPHKFSAANGQKRFAKFFKRRK